MFLPELCGAERRPPRKMVDSPVENIKDGGGFARKASRVSFATLISRILGYIRDMLIANFFGATMAADAFFVAYRIPNLLRKLLGEGSLSTSFIPVYTQYLTTGKRDSSRELLRAALGIFGTVFIILTAGGIILAPQLVSLIAPGFRSDPEKFLLTVRLTRIMFPFLIAIGLGAITLGILNSRSRFFIPAIAPCMLSISEIFFILVVVRYVSPPIRALAYGVVVGGFGQLLVQLVPVLKMEKKLIPSLNISHPGIRKIGRLMLPAIAGLSIMQVNSFVDTICATLLEAGSVTHLYYGNRLMQFPLALFGTAVATVMLPQMSRHAAGNDLASLKEAVSVSLRSVSFLILPASAGLLVFGGPIVRLLFERGLFTPEDTAATSFVLAFYACGLIFYSGVKIMAGAFHSMQDTKTPVKVASIAMIINVILNIIVVTVEPVRVLLSSAGLAGATAAASAVNFLLLIAVFRIRFGLIGGKAVFRSVAKHLIASFILGFFLYYASRYTAPWPDYASVPAVIAGGVALYLGISRLLAVPELEFAGEILAG